MRITQADLEITFADGTGVRTALTAQNGIFTAEKDGMRAELTVCGDGTAKKIKFYLNVGKECGLAADDPVKLILTPSAVPERLTAVYLFKDWWTRPAFLEESGEIPDRTQCIYLDYPESKGCLLFNAGRVFKAEACSGEKGRISVNITCGCAGAGEIRETLFYASEAENIFDAVRACGEAAAKDNLALTAGERHYPEMFEYLGWCSWNAFYTDINEQKVRDKADELREKNVPVRWILMDDGWLANEGRLLTDYRPDRVKFPNAFRQLTEDLKADGRIRQVGVWHAFPGYWDGIKPGSELEKQAEGTLYRTKNGRLLPDPSERGSGFYTRWYRYLRNQGIDFVKVDGQSDLHSYYDGEIPLCEAASGLYRNLEGAVGTYMQGNVINCMGMASESIRARNSTSLSRNSDDFFPDLPDSFTEHMKQNAYNAPYHSIFNSCDWDMFFTFHRDSEKHALLRAISGGPVYFADRIGETRPEILAPLVFRDGRILRMERAAMPAVSCMFTDPEKTGWTILTNICGSGVEGRAAGAEAFFNLSGEAREFTASREEIHDLPAGEYVCWLRDKDRILAEGEMFTVEPGKSAVCLFLPVFAGGAAVIGRSDKFMSPLGTEAVFPADNGFSAVLKEGGEFSFIPAGKIGKITVNGTERTENVRVKNGVCTVDADGEGKVLVLVQYDR